MESHSPEVSVIIISHQPAREKFLREAVDSVLSQTLSHERFEVIVVCAYANSNLSGYLNSVGVKQVTIGSTTRAGPLFNLGILTATSSVLCFLDDDDTFEPTKLEIVTKVFAAHPEVGFIHNQQLAIDETGRVLGELRRHTHMDGENRIVIKTARDYGRALVGCAMGFNSSSMSIRRSLLLDHLGALEATSSHCDSFFALVAALSGQSLLCSNRVLTRYRVHPGGHAGTVTSATPSEFYSAREKYFSKILADVECQLSLSAGTASEGMLTLYRDYCLTNLLISREPPARRTVARNLAKTVSNPMEYVTWISNPLTTSLSIVLDALYLVSPGTAKTLLFRMKRIGSDKLLSGPR